MDERLGDLEFLSDKVYQQNRASGTFD
jgi:hypothetical protein